MASSYLKTLLQRQVAAVTRKLSSDAVWLVPALIGGGWLLWPCLDLEWKIEMGLAKDPESEINYVQEMKNKRYEAMLGKKKVGGKQKNDEDEEEEEEPEEEAPEEESDQQGGSDNDEGAGDDDAGEEEDEEETKIVVPPLYVPTKGKLSTEEVWDNFTIKTVNWLADDDDDEDEDDE